MGCRDWNPGSHHIAKESDMTPHEPNLPPFEIPKRVKNLIGKVYGRLTVCRFFGQNKHGGALWICDCSCGKEWTVSSFQLVRGYSRSCGCLRDESRMTHSTTHGHSSRNENGKQSPTYISWLHMNDRCSNPKSTQWKYYGGRGIEVCEEWRTDFTAFLRDMGHRPEGLTLDRMDGEGNYELANCRWATQEEQVKNRRKKTHCKNGHEFSDDNVLIDKRHGGRTCKICKREDSKRRDKLMSKRDRNLG